MASSRLGGVERARLHLAGDAAVERGDGDGDLGEAARGHAGQDIDVAHHQGRLGDDADRMAGAVQHLEDGAGYAALPLDRLIGVGDGAERYVFRHVAGIAEFLLQQLGGVDLGVELGLEIEARRVAEVGMRGAGEAVDAAVLATPIGVDGLVEADVGAVVAGDDAFGRLVAHVGLEGLQLGEALPAVIERLAQLALVAADAIGARAAAAASLGIHEGWVVIVHDCCRSRTRARHDGRPHSRTNQEQDLGTWRNLS